MAFYSSMLPEQRRPLLAAALRERRLLRALECHNPLSAMLVAAARSSGGEPTGFDALWISGFAHATSLGLPDVELSILERRVDTIADIAAVSSLPMIVDADTGGADELAFTYLCRRLEVLGVSAVIVEDKAGAKRTSLAANVHHELANPEEFAAKIAHAKAALQSKDLMVFARIESLIAGTGLDDALSRAEIYLNSAADGVVIHSKDKTGEEIFAFMQKYRDLQQRTGIVKPLVLIPTAYNHVPGRQLHERGASIVIHGNHMIRAAFKAMSEAAISLLDHDRSLEADTICAPVRKLFDAVGVGE